MEILHIMICVYCFIVFIPLCCKAQYRNLNEASMLRRMFRGLGYETQNSRASQQVGHESHPDYRRNPQVPRTSRFDGIGFGGQTRQILTNTRAQGLGSTISNRWFSYDDAADDRLESTDDYVDDRIDQIEDMRGEQVAETLDDRWDVIEDRIEDNKDDYNDYKMKLIDDDDDDDGDDDDDDDDDDSDDDDDDYNDNDDDDNDVDDEESRDSFVNIWPSIRSRFNWDDYDR